MQGGLDQMLLLGIGTEVHIVSTVLSSLVTYTPLLQWSAAAPRKWSRQKALKSKFVCAVSLSQHVLQYSNC